MIHYYSLGRAARYFPNRAALASGGTRSTFRELHTRVGRISAALTKHSFKAGDRAEALRLTSLAVDLDPHYADARLELARLLQAEP